MFLRLYKYSLLCTLRQKIIMFWSLVFPIVLGTLFQVCFGDFSEEVLMFRQIPVAYVTEDGEQEAFTELLERLETDSGLVTVKNVTKEEAETLLQKEKVEGIYYTEKRDEQAKITLIVTKQDMSQSILSSVLEQYERTVETLTNIGTKNPAGIEAAVSVLEEEAGYLKENSITNKKMDIIMDYFYSLIAMTCLFGSSMGLMSAIDFKADLSGLAARRVVASTNRFISLFADVAAKVTIQFFCTAFSVCYLMYALKVSFGEKLGLILLISFLGSTVGVFIGFFIGVAGRLQEAVKEGICVGISLLSSFLSGLMVGAMYRVVETYAPFVHKVNPASLIVKALYSLNIYDTYDKYVQCVLSLLALIILLGIGSFVMVRRERYASI